jgi:hypothetical protein
LLDASGAQAANTKKHRLKVMDWPMALEEALVWVDRGGTLAGVLCCFA